MVVYSTYCIWLQFVTSCSFHSVCLSLWGLRSYSITYVNFKVLYIPRGNDGIFTRLFAAFFISVAFRMESGVMNYGWYRMTRVSVTKGVQRFYGKGPHPLFWAAGSRVARGKIKKWCASPAGLCPWVGDPCHIWNCTLNRSLATLQLSCSFCYCVTTCAVQMWCGAACEGRKFPPFPVFPSLSA